jgi:hypothetical protein
MHNSSSYSVIYIIVFLIFCFGLSHFDCLSLPSLSPCPSTLPSWLCHDPWDETPPLWWLGHSSKLSRLQNMLATEVGSSHLSTNGTT